MSVFRNAKKIERGALPDEEDDSDDDESVASGAESESESEGGGEGSEGDAGEEEGRDSGSESGEPARAGKKRKTTAEDTVKAGMKWVKPGRAGDGESEDEDDEDEGQSDEEDSHREIAFPAQCSLCKKTLFNMGQLNDHMVSKGHAKKQKVYDKGKIAFFRTPAQIAKLKERNQRKKDRKIAKKREAQATKGHVWGEHRKPPKSREQRAAEAAAAAKKPSPAAQKMQDKRTRAEKRASARGEPLAAASDKKHRHGRKDLIAGKHSKERSNFEVLPKQQGKRKNRT
jgi:hypothetical protein